MTYYKGLKCSSQYLETLGFPGLLSLPKEGWITCKKEFVDMQMAKEYVNLTGREVMERQLGIDK